MKFRGTRGESNYLTFTQVVLNGMAENGGLWVPEKLPYISKQTQEAWRKLDYKSLSLEIMKLFIDDIPSDDLSKIIAESFSDFKTDEVVEIKPFGNDNYFLNLYHGPTYSFKDVALQFLGALFEYMIEKGYCHKINIVGSTSGDTGSAAIAGVKGKRNITCTILFPKDRTSLIQELQMTTSTDENIKCVKIEGTYDDCQDIVKSILKSNLKDTHHLVAVNSINFARILAQMTYFWYTSLKLTSNEDEKIDVTVPTGNFGNILSGYYARKMNAPLRHLIIASNSNDILTRFNNSGTYQSSTVIPTMSPAMDIQISSNFERFIFEILDYNTQDTHTKFTTLSKHGNFNVERKALEKCQQEFFAFSASEDETLEGIGEVYEKYGLVIDPHTAVGYVSKKKYDEKYPEFSNYKHVVISTAHFGKFLNSVEKILHTHDWKSDLPEDLKMETLKKLPEKFTTISANKNEVEQFLLKFL